MQKKFRTVCRKKKRRKKALWKSVALNFTKVNAEKIVPKNEN